jgi:phenylalanine-4-hydroxylase
MALTKPNQELRRDLKAAASALEDAVHDLFGEAKTFAEPDFLAAMEKIGKLHEHVDRLMEYAEEVRAKRIVRGKAS